MARSKPLFGKKQVTIHKGFLFVIVALIIGSVSIYCFQTYLDFREAIKFGAALFVAGLTITSILITAENIRRSTEERRAASASAFIARYNDPRFFDQLLIWRIVYRDLLMKKPEEVAAYINQGWSAQGALPEDEQQLDTLKAKYNRRFIAVQMFNFFEEVAVAIEEEQADEKTLYRYFETVIPSFYSAAEPWIRNQQQTSSSQVYITVERLVNRWNNRVFN